MYSKHNSVFNSVLSSVLQYSSSVLQYLIHQHANFALHVPNSKFGNVIRNIQNKLGKRALKSDLKSTVYKPVTDEQVFYDKFNFHTRQVHVCICNIFYMTSFHMTNFTLLV